MRKLLVLFALLFILDSRIANAQDDCPPGHVRHPAISPLDDTYMRAAFRASFVGIHGREPSWVAGSGIDDGAYYIRQSNHFGVYGDDQCHAGWSGYWESWLRNGHGDLSQVQSPAHFLPTQAPVPDPTPIPPAPQPPVITPPCESTVLFAKKLDMLQMTLDRHDKKADEFYTAVGIQWKKISVFAAKYGSAILAGFLTHQATK